MTRGILYYIWDNYNAQHLSDSIASAAQHGYEADVFVCDNKLDGYRKRCDLFKVSPFDITLHLDTDTLIKGNIDFGFEKAEIHGMAMSLAPAYNAHLAASPPIQKSIRYDLPQYNCGVIFFNKNNKIVKSVFEDYAALIATHPEAATNDQPYMSVALEANEYQPYILTKAYNYRPHVRYEGGSLHGDVKILHSRK